jgi:REP-associated tyrosine transposase
MAVPPRRTHIPGTYFVTSRTWESRELFIKPPVCEIVVETLLHYRDQSSYLLHSVVLMPDHFHLLLTPGPAIALERAVQFIKGGSARRISQALNFRLLVWQRGFTDHWIRDAQDYKFHLAYIEQNPVKDGLALSASEYPWSSACGRFPVDECPRGLKPLFKGAFRGTVETVPFS